MTTRPARRVGAVLALVLLVVMINLPLAHSSWTRWRVDRSGTDVIARVVAHGTVDGAGGTERRLTFRFAPEVDPAQRDWGAEVDRATYDAAVASGEVGVRVLPGHPAAYAVPGQPTHRLGLVVTLLADLVLLVVALLAWRFRGRGTPVVRLVAVEDVSRARPGSLLEPLADGLVLVRGEVLEREDHLVVLDLGDRRVEVALDGHTNPVGHQQPAQVRARPLEGAALPS